MKNFTSQNTPFHPLICLRLVNGKPFGQPPEFLPAQTPHLGTAARPLKASAVFQSLVQQNKAIPFPEQGLDSIPPPAAKQKQAVGKRVQRKLLLYHLRQSVYPAPQVGISAGQVVDMIYPADFTQHAGSPE